MDHSTEFLSLIKLLNDSDFTGFPENVLPTAPHSVTDHKEIFELIFTVQNIGLNQVGSYNVNEHGLLNLSILGVKHQIAFNMVKISLTTVGGFYYLSLGYSSTTFPPAIIPGNIYGNVTFSPIMGGTTVMAGLVESPRVTSPFDREMIEVLLERVKQLEIGAKGDGCCYKCKLVAC